MTYPVFSCIIVTHTQKGPIMGYIISFILGIVVATVGVSGIARVADQGVHKVQEAIKETANK